MEGSFPDGDPWLAIPYSAAERTATNEKYQPPGVPTLTIVNLDGKLIELEGDMQIGMPSCFDEWLAAAS